MRNLAVIMSLYANDRPEFVREAVESILNQSYDRFDFYLIYDGPVKKEVDEYVGSLPDDRLHVVKRDRNLGLACSLNELLQLVLPKGYSYIARMDADDVSLPERFAKQVAYLDEHPETECLGTWAVEMDAAGNDHFHKRMPATHDACFELFRKRDCMIHPTVMFRRTYFDKAGLYPEDTYFGEDMMMWAAGFKNGCRFANVPEFLFRFRLDENFFKRRRGWKHARSILTLRRRVKRMLGFGWKEDVWALLYAAAKLMPSRVLNIIYKTCR